MKLPVRRIPLKYDHDRGNESALELVFMLFPEWEIDRDQVKIIQFTEGIMNTVGLSADLCPQRLTFSLSSF